MRKVEIGCWWLDIGYWLLQFFLAVEIYFSKKCNLLVWCCFIAFLAVSSDFLVYSSETVQIVFTLVLDSILRFHYKNLCWAA
eukprot:m.27072 g.27072  ORF g.27072 m.27072 type:complete len:82 (+) comp29741_c0_seq1:396-641(+)